MIRVQNDNYHQVHCVHEADAPGELEVMLYNHLGQPISRQTHVVGTAGPYAFTVDNLAGLVPSLYVIRVDFTSRGETRTKAFTVVKE